MYKRQALSAVLHPTVAPPFPFFLFFFLSLPRPSVNRAWKCFTLRIQDQEGGTLVLTYGSRVAGVRRGREAKEKPLALEKSRVSHLQARTRSEEPLRAAFPSP